MAVSNRDVIMANMKRKSSAEAPVVQAPQRSTTSSWHMSSQPTEAETVAQIYRVAQQDRQRGEQAYSLYQKAKAEGAWNDPYSKPTTKYGELVGIDPITLNDDNIRSLVPYLQKGVQTASGGLSSAKGNGSEAVNAYNLSNLMQDYENTKAYLAEQDEIVKEAQYWIRKGLSDDEIKAKLNIGGEGTKYTKIKNAIDKAAVGEVVRTTSPLWAATSYGVDSMLWGLRNPGQSTGDKFMDAVQMELGRGNAYVRDEAKMSRLDATSDSYNPYMVGTTMDDLAIKYGVDRFDKAWIDQNRGMLNDPATAGDYTKIYNAYETTALLQNEADRFKAELARYVELGVQPDYDAILKEGSADGETKFSNLQKLDESLNSGNLLATTDVIDYDLKALKAETDRAVQLKQNQLKAASDIEAANKLAEEEKKNWFEQAVDAIGEGLATIGGWFTTPKETVEPPKALADETPEEAIAEGATMFSPQVSALAQNGNPGAAAEVASAELAGILEQNPELLTTDNTQKMTILAMALAGEAGILTDPEQQEKAKAYQDAVTTSMSVDMNSEESKGILGWLDDMLQTGGALVAAQENEGLGLNTALMLLWDRAMARGADTVENLVGGAIAGLGELTGNEWMIEYGKRTMERNDLAVEHYDAVVAENGTPIEILAVQQGSEVAHMAQMGTLAKGVSAYNAIKTGGATNFLTRVLTGSPFALESGGATLQETYTETDNYMTALAAGVTATAVTSVLSQWDGILRNIEANGMPYIPEVVKKLGSVPGSGAKACVARWGKGAGMWLMNGLKTIVNESAQEAVEGGATGILVGLIKGENLSEMDWEKFGKDRLTDAVGSVFLSLGSAVSTMPTYARSVKVAESQMRKSDMTAQDMKTFVEAVKEDLQDPAIVAEMDKRAEAIAVETRTGELIAEGAMQPADASVLEAAQVKADEAAAVEQAASEARVAANEKLRANPADEAAKNEAIKANQEYAKAHADAEKAREELSVAQAENEAVAAEQMELVRQQAAAEVTERIAAVEQNILEQQAAAEMRRQEFNVAALEANGFIEDTYADATNEDRNTLQNAYVATASEERATEAQNTVSPIDKNAVEFTTQLSKLFKVKFKFVESDSDFEGKYRNGVITINKKTTQGEAIKKVALHELVHHVEKTGEYKALVNMVKDYFFKDDAEAYDREVEGLRQLYESQKDSLGITEEIDYTYGERELVAEYAARIFEADEQFVERIVAEKPSLAVRIAESLKNIVDKLRGVNDPELDMIRKAEKAFRKALEKSADPRTRSLRQSAAESAHPNAEQFSISQFARAAGLQMRTNSDGDPYTIVDTDGNEVKNVTSDMIKTSPMGKLIATAQNSGTIDADTAQKQYDMFAELMTMVAEYKDQAMIWEIAGSELFSAIKSNSDTQYSTTVDFGTICSKTREVVNVMSETMLKKGRGLTREEVIDAYNNTHKAGMAVPCPVCYVFSRWMGVPSLLETMRKGQERFANATDADVNAYLKSVSEKYGIKGKDLSESVGKAKTKVQNKLKKISESLLKDVFKNNADKTALIEQAKALEAELDEIEMFNWVNQVLCKTDRKRKPILDKDGNVTIDPRYKAVPNEVLLDLRRTGEFASDYAKAWTFRTTRGAGMGKAILPYSGAELGDTISGVKRWAASQNPYFTGDDKAAARKMKFAQIRAKVQNLIGGQRFQSTSDYRPEWGLDYLSTFLEMQAIGAKGQLYTKVIEAVDMFATAGIEVNMSIMPKNNGYHLDENGNPVLGEEDFSDVTGISFKGALEKTQKYDNAQMILVGINDTHIELAMADDRITFIIPWHSSGNSKDTLTTLMNAVGESLTNAEDYTDIQTDKPSANQTPEQKAMWDLRMEILTGKLKRGVSDEQQKLLDSNPYLKTLYEKFYVDESATDTYGVKLSKAQAGQIFPHEYWDTSLTMDQADENGRRFVEYCATMGIEPRFGKFSDKPGYWKLLIDRRMYNRDGTYHVPQTIDVTKVDIADVAAEVSQAKVGTPEQISEAVQGTIDDINARLPAEQFDMQAEVDIDSDDASGQYSIPSDDVLKRQVRSWRSGRSEQEQQLHGDGERQFVVQTLPNNPNIPEWAVEGLLNNPNARYYEKDTNRDQLVRGWQRVQENGVQSEVERLLSLDTFTADDTAESNLLMAMALREDTADPATFFALAEKSAVVSTGTAQALQARKMISKMTPDGIKIWAAGQLEQGLREHMRTHQPQRQQVDEAAAQVADQIRDLQSGDEVLRLNAGGDFTIDESNNRWGIPINEQQQALIDHYKLNKVARPGIFYNRATMEQRMLEAIIATPNPLEVTGLGLNLIQRLEFMKRGEAVITNADLNYMGTQLGQFVALGEEAGGRAADLALARAYEAFGNITPATRMEKFRTQRYVNMLSTFTSFSRNIIGNAGQNVVNAAAHGIGVEIDRLTSLGTGRRTMAHLSTAERIEGWKAFAEETKNTFLDFFVDKVNTAPNRDKYNTNQRGRTFQSNGLEIAKDIESFLMSVGDRNVWKKAFVNSMAEQQKLADRNQLFNADGTTRTQEQMVEQAEADANYATFTEESLAQDVMNYLRSRNPVAADVISLYIPFTGVPHNIMKRNFQYSPFGFLTMASRMAANKVQGRRFDQHAFVNDLSRALTGTGGVLAGVMLGLGGIIKMGTEDEEKDKVYDVETALGEQYTPYVYDPTTDTYVSMSTFAPSASPLVWGASIGQMLQNDEFNASALISAMTSSVDSIFDASYLSGLSDLFGGYGSFAENLAHVTAENLSSQLTPAFLNQVANAMDPYVRETKDKDYLVELMKTTMSRIPGLRNMLPEKVTVSGENVMTKQSWSLVDPFTRTNPSDNAALIEAKRLYDVTGSTNVLPSDALRGRKNEIKADKKSVVLDDKQKEEYKKYYGQLWTAAVTDLMNTPAYQLMDDDERADRVEDIMTKTLKQAKKEFIERYGK